MAHHTHFIFEGKKTYVKAVTNKSVADFPILKKEFDAKKNNIDPKLVPYRSEIKFHWKCKKAHEFQITPGNRFTHLTPSTKLTRKSHAKCPVCRNRKFSKENSLKILHPKIVLMWNYKKNILKPDEVYARSTKRFWWICKKKHVFQKEVYQMVKQKGFCGGCGTEEGRYFTFLTKENSLEFRYPELAKEWHPTKNKPLEPKDVFKPTVKYWWKCPKGYDHEYQQDIWIRTKKGVGCPFCAFKKLTKTNSLKYMYPLIAASWHPSKNGKITPDKVKAHSSNHAWWICKKKHVWRAMINSRTVAGHGCNKCTGRGISYMEIRIYAELINIFKDIKWSYKIKGYEVDLFIPQINLAIEVDGYYWHKRQNRIDFDYKKSEFLRKTNIKLIRVRENGLPLIDYSLDINSYFINIKIETIFNLLNKIKLITNSQIIHRQIEIYKKNSKFINDQLYRNICSNLPSPIFENSLEYKSKNIAKEWDYKKNFPLVPSMFKPASNLDVWWLCKKKHSYKAKISNRHVGRGCPYCVGRYALPDFNLRTEFTKIAKEWNYKLNGKKKSEDFTPISGQFVWWNCKNGHIYRKSIAHRTAPNAIPKNKTKSIGRNRDCPCNTKHQSGKLYGPQIFPLLRNEYSPKNKKDLSVFNLFSKEKLLWKCKNNHEYKNSVYRRIFYNERCFKCIDKVILLRRPLHDKNETKMLK